MNLMNGSKPHLGLSLLAAMLAISGIAYADGDGKSVDIAWDGRTFKVDLDPEGKMGKFGGTHFIITGIVYPGGTLSTDRCQIIDNFSTGKPPPLAVRLEKALPFRR